MGIALRTGARFALRLAVGIAIGRIGCFLAGLDDFTYGTPTTLPFAHDFGDGIARHPVQLYESASMAAFAIFYVVAVVPQNGSLLPNRLFFAPGYFGGHRFFLAVPEPSAAR